MSSSKSPIIRNRIVISEDEEEEQQPKPRRIDSSSDSDEENSNQQTPNKKRCSDEPHSSAGHHGSGQRHIRQLQQNLTTPISSRAQRLVKYQNTYYRDEYDGDREDAMDVEDEEDIDDFIDDGNPEESDRDEGTSGEDDEDEDEQSEDEEEEEQKDLRKRKRRKIQEENEDNTSGNGGEDDYDDDDEERRIGRRGRDEGKEPTRRSRRIQRNEENKTEEEEEMRRKLLERRWGNGQVEEKEEDDEIVEIDVDETLPTRDELTSTATIQELAGEDGLWKFPKELVLRVAGIESGLRAGDNGYPLLGVRDLLFYKAHLENDEGTRLELQAWWDQQGRIEDALEINGVYIFSKCQVHPVAPCRVKYNEGTQPITLSFGPKSSFRQCRLVEEDEDIEDLLTNT